MACLTEASNVLDAHERLRSWSRDGTWQKTLDHVIVKDDSVGDVLWVISLDFSVVRSHQYAACAQRGALSPSTGRCSGAPEAG